MASIHCLKARTTYQCLIASELARLTCDMSDDTRIRFMARLMATGLPSCCVVRGEAKETENVALSAWRSLASQAE